MLREAVYMAIGSEREYQDAMTERSDRADMLDDMPLPAILLAIDKILCDAKTSWYKDSDPYADTMQHVRKIAGLCVKAGEKYGMESRKW